MHDGHLRKEGITSSLLNHCLKKQFFFHINVFFSIGNIIMIYVIAIPMGSDPPPLSAKLFLALKETAWVKAQYKLGTINLQKINNFF